MDLMQTTIQQSTELLQSQSQQTNNMPLADWEAAVASITEQIEHTVLTSETSNAPGMDLIPVELFKCSHEMMPQYLQRNLNIHTWPFSAIAELIDNATDSSVRAKQLWIDVTEIKKELCLTFTDNGCGMTPLKLQRMLSFGFIKVVRKSQLPSSVLGNGFKSGSMRLGKDVIVFTKNGGALSVGLLSQTYLDTVGTMTVIMPVVPFSQQNKKMIKTEDSVRNLEEILKNSLFNTEEELLAEFDTISSKKGTRIIIWNIHRNNDGNPELDFESDKYDIRMSQFRAQEAWSYGKKQIIQTVRPDYGVQEHDCSFRAYCSVLYLKPRMQIFLRQKKVKTRLISKSLANVKYDIYKPSFINRRVKVTFGCNCENKEQFGMMMYHNNRLIKAYEKVGCQLRTTTPLGGVGVIGVIECNFLKPTHNKQDFVYSNEYRLTMATLGQKLNTYCKEKSLYNNSLSMDTAKVDTPDQTWVQCEECLKWRKLPARIDAKSLPDRWFCGLHPQIKYRSCIVPEEQEGGEEELIPTNERQLKNQVQNARRQRRKSSDNEKSQVSSIVNTLQSQGSSKSSNGTEENNVDGYEAVPPFPHLVIPTLPLLLEIPSPPFANNGHLEKSAQKTPSKHKLSMEEDWQEKRRRCLNQLVLPHANLSSAAPDLLKSPNIMKLLQKEKYLGENIKEVLVVNEGSTTLCRSKIPQGVMLDDCQMGKILQSLKYPEVQSDLSPNHPKRVEDSGIHILTNDNSSCIRFQPYTENVTVSNRFNQNGHEEQQPNTAPTLGLANIFKYGKYLSLPVLENRDKIIHGSNGENEGICIEHEGLQELSTEEKMETYQTQLARSMEKLANISAERNVLKRKVENLENEKCRLEAEYQKTQHELVTLKSQDGEGLYWSKKHMGYRQAEIQVLTSELQRVTDEKLQLVERLGKAERQLEVLRETHLMCGSPERGDFKRRWRRCWQMGQENSTLEKLKDLRVNVRLLLSSVLPHLELQKISFDSDQLDDILRAVLEINKILE